MDRVFHQLTVLMATTFLSVLVFAIGFPATHENPIAESGELAIGMGENFTIGTRD